ncbi:hypothetical protein JTB14_027427 [Gonioctena quinquepunctata]|nr:hypothetical protein JTB14_027427 [Gonioctena quinquepunctata]
MKSPLRTVLANNSGGIKKIAFPNVAEEMLSPRTAYCMKNGARNYDDEFSASGDFSIQSDQSPRISHSSDVRNFNVAAVEEREHEVEVVPETEQGKHSELEEFVKFRRKNESCNERFRRQAAPDVLWSQNRYQLFEIIWFRDGL